MTAVKMMGTPVAVARLPVRSARLAVCVKAAARPSMQHTLASIASAERLGAGAALLALTQAAPAVAEEVVAAASTSAPSASSAIDVDGTIDQLIAALKTAGTFIKSGADVVGSGVETLKEGYNTAEPYLQQGYSQVAPVLRQALDATESVVGPAFTAAAPVIKDSVSGVASASGISLSSVGDAVGTVGKVALSAALAAAPVVGKAATFVATTPPVLLGEYALGALAVYLVAPKLLGGVLGSFRGFAGELTATAAVDLVVNGDALLVDLRSKAEKAQSGVPDLPSSARDRSVEVEFATTEDRRLRSQLRDATGVESQVTALQVAALKRVGKGSSILLLDRYGSNSRSVAKELAAKGYGKVFVIAGGFDGRSGWVQSKLQIKPAAVDFSLPVGTRGTARKQLQAPRGA